MSIFAPYYTKSLLPRSAARRGAFAHRRMSFPQVGYMIVDLLFGQRSLPFRNGGGKFVQLFDLDLRHFVRADVISGTTRIDHAVRHLRLERAVSGERHDAGEIRLVDSEVVRKRADVPVVLSHRILEAAFLAVDRLRPHSALLVSEYPTRISLGLDDEDTVLRNDDVVDLRRRPVRQRQIDVVQNPVLVRESPPQSARHQSLPAHALLLRAVPPEQKYPTHNQKRERASKHYEHRLERFNYSIHTTSPPSSIIFPSCRYFSALPRHITRELPR